MDEFGLAQERAEKAYLKRHGVPMPKDAAEITETPVLRKPDPVVPQEKTRQPFTQLAVAISNGDETYFYDFRAPDLLENMMHSDRDEKGIYDLLLRILRSQLSSGIT